MKQTTVKALALCTSLCVQAGIAQEWQRGDQAFEFTIDQSFDGQPLRFLVDGLDISELVKRRAPGRYEYDGSVLALPSGELTLSVFAPSAGEWQEVDSHILYVLTPQGFEHAVFETSTTIAIDSQLDAGAEGDGFVEDNYANANLQFGMHTEHRRGDFSVESNTNIVGMSDQESALQFSERGENAPAVDLSDYIVTVNKGDFNVSLGHTSFGQHPLLLDSLSHRGIAANYQLNPYIGVGISQQSGSAIVGWNNVLGINEADHRIQAATIQLNALPNSKNALLLEYTWVDGKRESNSDFDVGQVTDVEEQSGWGFGLNGKFFNQRLRIDGAFAESEYRNPFDANLAFFNNEDEALSFLVAVEDSTDTAWRYRLEWDVIKPRDEGTASATFSFQKERSDAQYRALVASTVADRISELANLQGQLQKLNWQFEISESENNVDNIPSILKTENKNRRINLNYALNEFALNDEGYSFLPALSLNIQRVHQRALNNPDAGISDFNGGSHLPDQVNDLIDFNANWNIGSTSLGYSYSESEQDNRQVGRDLADFERTNHVFNTGFVLFQILNISASYGRAENFDKEQGSTFFNRNGSMSVSMYFNSGWAIDAGYNYNRDFTSLGDSASKNSSANLGLSKDLQFRSISGQWSLRYAHQKFTSEDFIFDFNTLAEDWAFSSSLNITF